MRDKRTPKDVCGEANKIPASKDLASVESKISRFGFKDDKGNN